MYYNSNQNSNEYYSSYKQELSAIKPDNNSKSSLFLILKRIGIGILLLTLIFGFFYIIKNFSTKTEETLSPTTTDLENKMSNSSTAEDMPKIIISEENLPKSIQLQDSQSKIIANLKQNATDSLTKNSPLKSKEHNDIKKQVISLTETSNMDSNDIEKIINLILEKKKENSKSSLEKALLNAELIESKTQTLKESNHYNKILLSSKKENSKIQLTNLSDKSTKSNKKAELSQYEKSLKPEIATRKKEMRIIIVKKGDTLSKLALKAYGDIHAYRKIFKANPEIIKNPNQIFVGQKIRIPL